MVELFDYTENQDEIVLIMEYCNDAGYFEDKIESVSIALSILIWKIFPSTQIIRLIYDLFRG